MSLEEIKLSIIVPAYNIESYISSCIESLLSQDIKESDYEIIIINDGSNDNTFNIINNYKLCKSIKIINQTNKGLSEARNIGVKHSKGEYIWFVDGDDTITPMCLKSILSACKDKNVDMFGVGPSIPFTRNFPTDFNISKDISQIYTGLEWIKSKYGFIGAWAYIIKKEFWIKNNLSFMKGIYYEDLECISKAFYYANRICTLNRFSIYNYVQRPNSIMSQTFNYKKLDSRLKIASSILNFSNKVSVPEFKYYYKKTHTDLYITGITEIIKSNIDKNSIRKYIQDFKKIGKIHITASSVSQKIYQYVLINFPILYILIKRNI